MPDKTDDQKAADERVSSAEKGLKDAKVDQATADRDAAQKNLDKAEKERDNDE